MIQARVRRIPVLARLLWLTAGCGRLGFDGTDRSGGDAPSDIAPLGDAPAVASFAPTLAGTSTCGAMAKESATLAITNAGGSPLVVMSASATNGFDVMTPLPLAIPPGNSSTLVVTMPSAVIGTDLGGSTRTGVLTVTTSAGARDVALTSTVVGANLAALDGVGAPITLSFTSAGCPPAQNVYFTNSGNASASLSASGPTPFHAFGFSGGAVAAHTSAVAAIQPIISGACSGAFTVQYNVTGKVCTAGSIAVMATYNDTGSPCSCS